MCVMRFLHVLIPVGYGYLRIIVHFLLSNVIWVYIPCRNLHTQVKFSLVSIWFRMVLEPHNNSAIRRLFSPWDSHQISNLIGITISIPMGRFLWSRYSCWSSISCIHIYTDPLLVPTWLVWKDLVHSNTLTMNLLIRCTIVVGWTKNQVLRVSFHVGHLPTWF